MIVVELRWIAINYGAPKLPPTTNLISAPRRMRSDVRKVFQRHQLRHLDQRHICIARRRMLSYCVAIRRLGQSIEPQVLPGRWRSARQATKKHPAVP